MMDWKSLLLPLRPRDPHEPGRVATPLELLFDLVFVIAVGAATAGLHHAIVSAHGLDILPRFAFFFFAIWWSWMNYTWFASAFGEDEDFLFRLLSMVIMVGALMFAAAIGPLMDTLQGSIAVLGWCVMRLGMIGLWLRAASNPEWRKTALVYAVGIGIAQLCWIILFWVAPERFLLWGSVVAVIELAVPLIAERVRLTPFHSHHIIERYGLFTIISLGELMISIGLGFETLAEAERGYGVALTALFGAIIVFALFRLYFGGEGSMDAHATGNHFIWGYLHVFIFGAIAVIGAAVAAQIDIPAAAAEAAASAAPGAASIAGAAYAVTPDAAAAATAAPAAAGQPSAWAGGGLAVFLVALWLARDQFAGLPLRRALALPVMAAVAALAGWLRLPLGMIALIAVVAATWRNSPADLLARLRPGPRP